MPTKVWGVYTFTSNNSNAYLPNAKPSNLVCLKTYDTAFDKIIITFTDPNVENKK